MLRAPLKHSLVKLLSLCGLLAVARRKVAEKGIIVITLHRVVPDNDLPLIRSPRGMVIRESLFIELLRYLAQHAEVVSARSLSLGCECSPIQLCKSGRPRVLITFDDGWKDNYAIAWPHLHRAGMDAVFFVTTSLMGRAMPFWPEQFVGLARAAAAKRLLPTFIRETWDFASECHQPNLRPGALPSTNSSVETVCEGAITMLKQLDPDVVVRWIRTMERLYRPAPGDAAEALCSWEEIAAMVSQGAIIGSHTAHHILLSRCSEQTAMIELEQSLQHLLNHTGTQQFIAYPNGEASPAVTRLAHVIGYRLGFHNSVGIWDYATDPLMIPRINLWDGKMVGPDHTFSKEQLEYSLFWKPLSANLKTQSAAS